MKGSKYASATEEKEGPDFVISSSGGPLLSYLAILLFAALAPSNGTVEFSLETFHNKEYGARVELDIGKLAQANRSQLLEYSATYSARMKKYTFYTPVNHIVRFLDVTAPRILKPWKTACRHGTLILSDSKPSS